MLLDIKNYLETRGPTSMLDLTTHFDLEPETLRHMLAHWVRKGRLQRHNYMPKCGCPHAGSCSKCAIESLEVYEWVRRSTDDQATSADRPA